MSETRRIKVIGLGGIGTYLVEPLCRYLSHTPGHSDVTLVDGDTYEDRNRERQCFSDIGNKAVVSQTTLRDKFPKVHFKAKGEYVTEDNVVSTLREGDIVFLCVDNHATRKVVSDRCEELDNVTLISGGNDYTDGNVIYYSRKDGKDVTVPPTKLYPKIASPDDANPGEARARSGCEAQVSAAPQLLFTNLALASSMLNVYYAHEQGKVAFHQVFLDILTQSMRPSPEQEIVFHE